MILLHNVGSRKYGSNYNELDEIMALPPETPLSFDGVYRNVWDNSEILAHRFRNVTLFVMGNYVGKDNRFDVGQKLEALCAWDDIIKMSTKFGWKIGWHTWSHRNLCELEDHQVKLEVTPPFPMTYFAYPYGDVDERVERIVREVGFGAAWSVNQGDGSAFQKRRRYLNW